MSAGAEADAKRGRRWLWLIAAAATATLAMKAFHTGSLTGLAAARHDLASDSRFYNGPAAGAVFASASASLLRDGKACERHWGAADGRCRSRLAGAAWAQVSAVALLRCTQPGVFQARHDLQVYLGAVTALDDMRGRGPVPPLSPVVAC